MAYFQEGLLKISTEEIKAVVSALKRINEIRKQNFEEINGLTALEGSLLICFEAELKQRGE